MSERYRTDYDGEFVIISNTIKDGKKHQEREWIDNPIENQHISGRAAIIGHGHSRYNTKLQGKFDIYNHIARHSGGHLSRKRLQSYGSEGCWTEMQCDFFVEFDIPVLDELVKKQYTHKSSVYSNARNCITTPGEFFLVPYGFRGRSVVVAAWLACFDGHKEVYLLGVDGTDRNGEADNTSAVQLNNVMTAYPSVKFVHVSDNIAPPDLWRNNRNFAQWKYSQFVSLCDI
jgi:hypothetical protein